MKLKEVSPETISVRDPDEIIIPIKRKRSTTPKNKAIKAKTLKKKVVSSSEPIPATPKKPRKKKITIPAPEVIEVISIEETPVVETPEITPSETERISSEDQEDFEQQISSFSLPSLSEIKERYNEASRAHLDTLNETLLAHTITIKDIVNELQRVTKKHSKFKHFADTELTRNNYIENDDSWKLRQYAKHYNERMEALRNAHQEAGDIQSFLEIKIEEISQEPTSSLGDTSEFTAQSEARVLTEVETPPQKNTTKEKIKRFFKLLLKFYRPKN